MEKKYRVLYFEEWDRFLNTKLPGNNQFKIEPLQRIPGNSYVLREGGVLLVDISQQLLFRINKDTVPFTCTVSNSTVYTRF